MGTPSPSLPHFLKPPRAAQALPGAPISRKAKERGPPPPSMTKIEERKGRARDVPVPGPAGSGARVRAGTAASWGLGRVRRTPSQGPRTLSHRKNTGAHRLRRPPGCKMWVV